MDKRYDLSQSLNHYLDKSSPDLHFDEEIDSIIKDESKLNGPVRTGKIVGNSIVYEDGEMVAL